MDFSKAKDQMKELRERLHKESENFFKTSAKELFDTYPQLENFSWRQYTPYFCDGDPCEFGANTSDPNINGHSSYDHGPEFITTKRCPKCDMDFPEKEQSKFCTIDGAALEVHQERNMPENFEKMAADVCEFLECFRGEDLERMFGDHCEIIVSRTGVKVDPYTDHD